MQSSARLFNCARCRRQVVICSHCDRGNIYCGKRCSETARRQSQREAGRHYQKTRRGRFAHAERQRRYRQRRRQNATHQGSPPAIADETLSAESRTPARRVELPAARREAVFRSDIFDANCGTCSPSCNLIFVSARTGSTVSFIHGRTRFRLLFVCSDQLPTSRDHEQQ